MKTRKLVLIIADVLLLAVCIIQGVLAAHDGVKLFEFKEEPDEYTIVTPSESIHLVLEGDTWLINDQKYIGNTSSVEDFTDALNYIRALDKVGSTNEASLEKYEIIDGKKISVTASKAGKQLRSVEIGKEATTGSQNYVVIDGGKDIYLISDDIRSIFDKTVEGLRSRNVWNFDKSSISSVSITPAGSENWNLSRMGSGTDIVWNMNGPDTEGVEVDATKATNWLEGFASMITSGWYADGTKPEDIGGTLVVSAKVGYNFATATIDIYAIEPAEEGGSKIYYGTSSETPYVFGLAPYQAEKFTKRPSELGL